MTSVSRFVSNIFGLAGTFAGKEEKNYSNTLSSKSHNSLIQASIHANLPLKIRHLKLSKDTKIDLF